MSLLRTAFLVSLLLALAAPRARAQLRYLTFADARGVYNSNVIELDATQNAQDSWDVITEVEPGVRLYYGQPRSLLSLRYHFTAQIFSQTEDPERGGPLMGYGNNLFASYLFMLSPRLEIAVANHLSQGTENVTQQSSLTASGAARPMAPRLAIGTRFVEEAVSFAVNYLASRTWTVRPMLSADIYYPYAGPPEVPSGEEPPVGANPVYSFSFTNQVARAFSTSLLLLGTEISVHSDYLDSAHKRAAGVQEQHDSQFPDYWDTLILGATAGWRWQITDFLRTQLGGGFALARVDRVDTVNQVLTQQNLPAPLVEATLRYHRGHQLSVDLGYTHGWTRQPELGQASTAETDAATLDAFYGLQDWTFEAMAAFLYLNMTSHGGVQGDANKAVTGQAMISYLVRPGLSIEASYRYDSLFDRVFAQGVEHASRPPDTVDRHVATLGVSVVWPPPPPQDVRLTRRESEYEPLFTLGQGLSAAEQRQRAREEPLRPQRQRHTRAPWERGTREAGPASLIGPPAEEEPPPPGSTEEDDPGYYSWPR